LDPGDPVFHYNYGWSLFKSGRHAEGISRLRESIRLDPTFDLPHDLLSYALDDPQHRQEALEEARQLLRLGQPDIMVGGHAHLRQLLLEMNRDFEARDDWRQTLEAYSPPSHDRWFGYAELCLFLGDEDGYRRARTDLLGRFGNSKDPTICERTAKACLLLDGDRAELEMAAALADRAEAAERGGGHEGSYPYDVFAQGLAAYRFGRFDEAIWLMKGKAASVAGPCPSLVVAMALYRKGEIDEARKLLSTTLRASDWSRKMGDGEREPYWVAQILRREAEALIQPQLQHNATSRPASTSPAAGAE
jgi:serine/threonine-protein kinase